jgi:hypothetical protein
LLDECLRNNGTAIAIEHIIDCIKVNEIPAHLYTARPRYVLRLHQSLAHHPAHAIGANNNISGMSLAGPQGHRESCTIYVRNLRSEEDRYPGGGI